MKTKLFFASAFVMLLHTVIYAQDEWESKTHFTGYINSVAEYSDLDNLKKEYAIGLSELGFLANYQPIEKLELKATLVYSHYTFHISQLIVEGYGMYHFNDGFKLGIGRFLTPLSPVNLYFYAPLNPSGVVPMLVSHHFLFPQSISGFQFAGELGASSSLKFGYNASIGTYDYINHFESGVMGILSQEGTYPSFGFYDTENDKINSYLCGTGRVYGKVNDNITLGANLFLADAQQVTQDANGTFIYYPSTKYTYGFDFHLNVSNIKVNFEYWAGQQTTTDETNDALGLTESMVNKYEAYYGEVIYDGNVFKPFVRWDYIKDVTVNDLPFPTQAATIGLAFRPRYETLLKLEYKRMMVTRISDLSAAVWTSEDYDYNYLQFSFVLSF